MAQLVSVLGQAILVLVGLVIVMALVMVLIKEGIWIRQHFYDGIPQEDERPQAKKITAGRRW